MVGEVRIYSGGQYMLGGGQYTVDRGQHCQCMAARGLLEHGEGHYRVRMNGSRKWRRWSGAVAEQMDTRSRLHARSSYLIR